MKSIMWFREIKKEDIPFVGGKGANLGEMVNEAFPVPMGFVVTAQAYFKYIEEKGIKTEIIKKIDAIDVEKTEELEKVSKEIRELILRTPMSRMLETEIKDSYSKMGERRVAFLSTREEEFVAVRSSATAEDLPQASFAGMQETFLNVKGRIEVLEAVKRCWASLFTARAVYYRKKQNFETEKVGIAVVVQKMVDSEIAGILFTADPTGDTSKIIIEAGFGLGEAVVSGSITPDTYTVEKNSFKIIEKKISKQEWSIERAGKGNEKRDVPKAKQMKQKLEDKFIVQLAKIGRQIENHYKKPMDIEWAVENKQLYIVQARPITTLGMKEKTDKEKNRMIKTKEKPIAKGLAASPGIASAKAVIIPEAKNADKVNKGDIIVTKMTNPDWVAIMEKAKGIITEEGGKTCHASIVSRELGIPCVVGVKNAMKIIEEGEIVTVDGYNGLVYKGIVELEKPEETEEEVFEDKEEIKEIKEELEEEGEKFGKEKDGKLIEHLEELMQERAIKVKVNVALPEAAEKAAKTDADGVGLLRAEHMITESGMHPAEFLREGKEEELIQAVRTGIKKVASLFKGKPVWYRTFDARSDEFRNLKGGEKEPEEDNPMIGWHGIRRSLDEPKLIQAEFKAIKELVEEGFTNLGVMLPFVISASELKKAKELALEVGLNPRKDVQFGVMIETPASVWAIDELIEEGLDFVSFGTNDLTQLTLGIDRNNERIQKLFSELHPAVLRSCEYVIKKCNKAGVITSICGQAASNEEMVEKLVEFGIKSVSANIDAVENIKRHVLVLEKRELLERMKKE
ncbi:phosphoenolpyruvate synthase [Candidatus Micrarchaeota archaeon]|nr:phosphoenolpyruvate synthase [Candidatus Micrarchaeota archaeon]